MRPIKGIIQNIRPQDQPENTYFYGKNGIQNDTIGAVQNEKGTSIDYTVIPGTHMGTIEADRGRAIVFSLDEGVSKIGYYDYNTLTWTKIVDDTDLDQPMGFTLDHWITGEFQRNFKDEVIAVFTDKATFAKILNCDNQEATTLSELRLFLQATTPTMTTAVTSGGSLEKGAYFVLVKYLKNDGSETDVVAISRPAIVSSPNAGTTTDKAIAITLTDLDTSFDQVQLFFVNRINGDYKAYEGPKLQIASTVNYTYTGEELFPAYTLEELLIPSPVYATVGTIGQLNDALYLADLTKEPELNLQKYANLVKLRVKSELISIIPFTPEHVSGAKRSLMHQEVYAVYIRYHRTAGGWTKAFHVPGNDPIAADLLSASEVHEADLGAKVFEVRDTNRSIVGTSCDTGIWQNTDELYPDIEDFDSSALGGRNLRNEKVLHHRMPSIAFCKTNYYPTEAEYGKSKLDILSLEVSNVSIPPEQTGLIDGYEILIAKRTLGNSLVIGQGLVLLEAQPQNYLGTNLNFISTGGNWHSTTVDSPGNSGSGDFLNQKALRVTGRQVNGNWAGSSQTKIPGARLRFHSFDMLFNQPAVTPTYLSAQLKYRVNNLNSEGSGYLEDGELLDDRVPVMAIIDYATKGITPTVPTLQQRTRVIEDPKYVPNNANTGEYQNTQQETVFVGKLKWIGSTGDTTNNDLPIDVSYSTVNLKNYQRPGQRFTHEETYLANLMDIKPNLYQVFYSQRLISSGTFIPLTTTVGQVYAGDIFISEYSFHTYGWFNSENPAGENAPNPNTDGGYKIVRRTITEAVSNIALRYEVAGNIYSKWWPHDPLVPQPSSPDGYLYDFDRSFDPNQFGYSRDLNTLNEFGNYEPFNPFLEDVINFPYRIHRGGKLPRQGKLRSWRNFLPLDYYEAQKNMGRIIRLVGKDDRLLIHHENALFQTQDKTKLESDVLSVTLGTGDIFQFEPQEVLSSKQGFAGTQHELAAVDSPFGYIFVDAKQGQIFLFKDGLKLMNEGLNLFLKQYLKGFTEKNPYTGNGITIGYDAEYRRVLVTVKNSTINVGLDNFVPNYEETQEFFDTLTEDVSIVYAYGRYLIFRGTTTCPTHDQDWTIDCGDPFDVELDPPIPAGTIVGSLTITNPSNATLTFVKTSGDTTGNFSINPTTGDLILDNYESSLGALEDGDTRTIVVTATDQYGNDDTCSYEITIVKSSLPPIPASGMSTIYVNDLTPDETVIAILSADNATENTGHLVDITMDPDNDPSLPFELDNVNTTTRTADLIISTGETIDSSVLTAYEFNVIFEDLTTGETTTVTITVIILPITPSGNTVVNVDACAVTSTITGIVDQDANPLLVASNEENDYPVGAGEGIAINIPATVDEIDITITGSEDWTRIVVVDSQGTEHCQDLVPAQTVYNFTGINTLGTGPMSITVLCDQTCAP